MIEIERLRLQKAIRDLHGCDSVHIASIPVLETFVSKTVWEGTVELFTLLDHLTAKEAYAWSYKNDAGQTRHVTVLSLPPVKTAIDAVRAYIAGQIQKQ